MSEKFYHEITDKQWAIIAPHLPKAKSTGRPSLNQRTVFNAICWVLSSGAKWRYIPKEYGNWNSIYHKFRNWIKEGVFEKILQSLIDSCKKYSLIEIDSTFCKVHQHAAGALKKLGDQTIGVSRGGKTSKIHVAVDEQGRPRKFILTAGNINDCDVACSLPENFALKGKTIIADRGYSTGKIKNFIEEHGAVTCIPPKSNFKKSWVYDREKYKSRNKIERFFGNLKERRHLATR